MRRIRDQLHVIQQAALRHGKTGFVQIALKDCSYALIGGSLNTQEVSMAVQSIRAAV